MAKIKDLAVLRTEADGAARYELYRVTSCSRAGEVRVMRRIDFDVRQAATWVNKLPEHQLSVLPAASINIDGLVEEIEERRVDNPALFMSARELESVLRKHIIHDPVGAAMSGVRCWVGDEYTAARLAESCEHEPLQVGCAQRLCRGVPDGFDIDPNPTEISSIEGTGQDQYARELWEMSLNMLGGPAGSLPVIGESGWHLPGSKTRRASFIQWEAGDRVLRLVSWEAKPEHIGSTMPYNALYVDGVLIHVTEGWGSWASTPANRMRHLLWKVRYYLEGDFTQLTVPDNAPVLTVPERLERPAPDVPPAVDSGVEVVDEQPAREPAEVEPDAPAVEPDPVPAVKPAAPVTPAVFTVDSAQLADALAYVGEVLPTRPSVPVLGGVLFTAAGDEVTVSGFDYDQARTVRLAATGVTPGRLLVGGKTLIGMLKAVPKTVRSVTVNASGGGSARIEAGTTRLTIPTMPAKDYPALPDVPPTIGTVDIKGLAEIVARVVPAAGTDDTIPVLKSMRLVLNENGFLRAAATDKYRIADDVCPWTPAGGDDDLSELLMPAKSFGLAMKRFASAAGAAGGPVTIGRRDDKAWSGVSFGRYTLVLRNHNDVHLTAVDTLWPATHAATATVNAAKFIAAIKRVTIGADKKGVIRLTWSAGEVTLATGSENTDGNGESGASESMPCTYDGVDGFTVAFNIFFLTSGVQAVSAKVPGVKSEGSDIVQFGFNHAHKSVIFTAGNAGPYSFRYLIQPVRVGGSGAVIDPQVEGTSGKPAITNRKGSAMPNTTTTTTSAAVPTKPAKTAGRRAKAATPTAAPASAPAAVVDADQAERYANEAYAQCDAGDFAAALATISAGEAYAPQHLIAGDFPWSSLREYIENARDERSSAEDESDTYVPDHGVEVDGVQVAKVRRINLDSPAAVTAAKPQVVDEQEERARKIAAASVKPSTGKAKKAAPVTAVAGTGTVQVHTYTLASYEATGVTYRAARQAVKEALRAAGISARVEVSGDGRREFTVATTADAGAVSDIVAQAVRLDNGQPAERVPAARPVQAVPAAVDVQGALVYTLESYDVTGVTYRAARQAVKEALRAAGISARVEVSGDGRREFTVTTTADTFQVEAIVRNTVRLAVLASA